MGEMLTTLPGAHILMPGTWMAVPTLNQVSVFGSLTLMAVAVGQIALPSSPSLVMTKPAEAALPGGSTTLVITPKKRVWPSVTRSKWAG